VEPAMDINGARLRRRPLQAVTRVFVLFSTWLLLSVRISS
jgi:hypothetical protein